VEELEVKTPDTISIPVFPTFLIASTDPFGSGIGRMRMIASINGQP
jgi:hypothetical protein